MKGDSEIWENFKNGDKSALSYIYFQNFHSMFHYGIKFKNDSEFIKDCIQEVFFKLIKAGKRLGSTDNIRFYLFRALKNSILRELENSRKVDFVDESRLKFESHFSLEEEILQKEKLSLQEKALADALNNLSSRQREIIYLKYECGMEYSQICELMLINTDSARKLVFRAIRSLKELINKQINSSILFFIHLRRKHVL